MTTSAGVKFTIEAAGAVAGAAQIKQAIGQISKALTDVAALSQRTQKTLNTAFNLTGLTTATQQIKGLSQALGAVRAPAGIAAAAQQFKAMGGAAAAAATQVGALNTTMATTGARAGAAATGLGNASRQAGALGASVSKVNPLMVALNTYLGATAVKSFGQSVYDSTINAQRFQSTLAAFVPSAEEADRVFNNLTKTVLRFGLDLASTRQNFGTFFGALSLAGYKTPEITEMFDNLAQAMRVFGLSAERQGLAMLAIQQMASKGKVTMEELQRQLAEQIPGAAVIFAKSMGYAEKDIGRFYEAVKRGDVTADKLRKFLQQLALESFGGLEKALQRADFAVAQFWSGWELFKTAIGESGFMDAVRDSFLMLAKGMLEFKEGVGFTGELTPRFKELATTIGQDLKFAIETAATLAKALFDNFELIRRVSQVLIGMAIYKVFQSLAMWVVSLGPKLLHLGTFVIPAVTKAFYALRAAIIAVSASTPLIAALSIVLGAAAIAIIMNWDKVVEATKGVVNWFKELFTRGKEDLGATAKAVSDFATSIIEWFENIPNAVADAIKTAVDAIGGFIQSVWDKIRGWADAIIQKLRQVIGLQAQANSNASAGIGARAMGGPVQGGKKYLVGELGPELFQSKGGKSGIVGMNGPEYWTAPSTGTIVDSTQTQAMISNAPSGTTLNDYLAAIDKWGKDALKGSQTVKMTYDESSGVQAGRNGVGGGGSGSDKFAILPPANTKPMVPYYTSLEGKHLKAYADKYDKDVMVEAVKYEQMNEAQRALVMKNLYGAANDWQRYRDKGPQGQVGLAKESNGYFPYFGNLREAIGKNSWIGSFVAAAYNQAFLSDVTDPFSKQLANVPSSSGSSSGGTGSNSVVDKMLADGLLRWGVKQFSHGFGTAIVRALYEKNSMGFEQLVWSANPGEETPKTAMTPYGLVNVPGMGFTVEGNINPLGSISDYMDNKITISGEDMQPYIDAWKASQERSAALEQAELARKQQVAQYNAAQQKAANDAQAEENRRLQEYYNSIKPTYWGNDTSYNEYDPYDFGIFSSDTYPNNTRLISITSGNFQTGGRFKVGGSGGADSQFVGLRASPGEEVSISSPRHVRHGWDDDMDMPSKRGSGGGVNISLTVNARDANSFRRSEKQIVGKLRNAIIKSMV